MKITNIETIEGEHSIRGVVVGEKNKTYFTLTFDEDIHHEYNEPHDTISDLLFDFFSFGLKDTEQVKLDWRGERTVVVIVG